MSAWFRKRPLSEGFLKAVGTLRPDGQTLKNQMKTIFRYWGATAWVAQCVCFLLNTNAFISIQFIRQGLFLVTSPKRMFFSF